MKAVTQPKMHYSFRSKTTTWQAIMNNFYYVYILKSEKNPKKHYTEFTNNFEEQFKKILLSIGAVRQTMTDTP